MVVINDLPNEILLRVFSCYLHSESQRNLVYFVGKVCKRWYDLCMDSSLWLLFDGSLPLRKLKEFSKNGYLDKTEVIKFSRIKITPTNDYLKDIYRHLPSLRCINLTNTSQFHEHFTVLKEFCPRICEIVIKDSNQVYDTVFPCKLFEDFLKIQGSRLISVDISYVHLSGSKDLFKIIASTCPNLEKLIAQGLYWQSSTWKSPTELMQIGCPKLKTLCLGFPIRFVRSCSSAPGFPNLETFSHSSQEECNFNNSTFHKLLHNSPNLKELDIKGCIEISVEAVFALPVTSLEKLSISKTRLIYSKVVCKLFKKWSHSLKMIDVSRMSGDFINVILESIIPENGVSKLESLNLNNTAVTVSTVRLLVDNCPKLTFLHLESCREMGLGLKHVYHGRKAIQELLFKLKG